MTRSSTTVTRTAARHRIIAPDLARGLTLLGIALANVGTAWVGNDAADLAAGYGGVYDNSVLDKISVVLGTMFVHVRGLPMFATLVGLGVGMITMSLWRRGYPPGSARGVLARRYGFLALFGLIHMVFIFFGDIMVFYGLAGIVLGLLISLRDKILLWIAGVLLALQAVVFTALGVFTALNPDISNAFSGSAGFGTPNTYGENLLLGLLAVMNNTIGFPLQALIYMPLLLLGFVAARRGVFTDVASHRRLLLTWTGVGAAVVVLIGLPWGLAEIGVLPVTLAPLFQMMNLGFGQLTGPAIIAAVALLSRPLQERVDRARAAGDPVVLPLPVWALLALGKRSMTGYVLQSVFFLIAVKPFALGLGEGQGAFELSLIAFVVWLLTLLIALGLEYAGKPGPLEHLHRLLSYGRNGLQQRWMPREHRLANAVPAGPAGGQTVPADGLSGAERADAAGAETEHLPGAGRPPVPHNTGPAAHRYAQANRGSTEERRD
ncbi:DUF418 domain-containing protein [Corynebacterium halotolerans]|uniref:DUF418 domain-containing protein n=1 Tax=Corynebacterium halotolerans TaxID=225326 RepID=UPI003CED3E13